MNKDNPADSNKMGTELKTRRPYAAPTVSDFFQPVVALGTTTTDGCAAPKPPKH